MKAQPPTIVILTISDLQYEANLHRKAITLAQQGFRVKLFCSQHPALNTALWSGVELIPVKLPAKPTLLKFFTFWLKALFYLLQQQADLFIAYDFLPLVPLRIKSFFQECRYIYDSIELVSGLNSLVHKPLRRFFFKQLEKFGIQKARAAFTVCELDAQALQKQYPKLNVVGFVRNIPLLQHYQTTNFIREKYRIPPNKKIGIYQGMIFEGRGLRPLIQAVKTIDEVVLIIVGDGPLLPELKQEVTRSGMEKKVIFTGLVPFNQLSVYTSSADFGVTLISGKGLSYYHALPNKLFEYIQAQIPVIGSHYPEIKKIIEGEKIGFTVDPQNIEQIQTAIKKLLQPEIYQSFKNNLQKISGKYSWQQESQKYLHIIKSVLPS